VLTASLQSEEYRDRQGKAHVALKLIGEGCLPDDPGDPANIHGDDDIPF